MKNNLLKFLLFTVLSFIFFNCANAEEQFKFNITEIEIIENGNLIIGSKSGKAETIDGYEIIGENFVYNKLTNILKISGNVKLIDKKKDNFTIFTDKATYLKNEEIVFTEGNSKAINENNTITASNFKFDKINNILNADEKVKFIDKEKDTQITSDKATYLKNEEIVFTEGNSKALIEKKYNFSSRDVTYNKNSQKISSLNKSTIIDGDENIYRTDNFLYEIENKLLKAENVNIISKIKTNNEDKYFFSEGFFDFGKKKYKAKETKINVHKDIFGNEQQDPRLYGSSSYGDEKETVINKGIFTSCKINENCTPWSIKSEKITHDKIKKDLIYKNAILKIYDIPVFYFPKFFHPDPTVERRSGFLQPQFNRSKTLGSSLYLPYFKTFGIDKDYTFKPTIFEDKYILQNEYRKKTKDSYLITDFSLTKGYESSETNKEKNINHLFLNFKKDLNLKNFISSKLNLNIERVNNDTYLKVFQNNLFPSPIMPKNKSKMFTGFNYNLEHKKYNLDTGFSIYESLGTRHSDRYQYVLPYYNFDKNLQVEKLNGSLYFGSSGSNNLKDTNNLKSTINNNLNYSSFDYFTEKGFKNKFNLYFKNLNSVGKNNQNYNSSPSIDVMSLFEISSSYPLLKGNDLSKEVLTPKISLRINPNNNMKNHSSSSANITANNIYEINRLAISDSFEGGKSLTLGLDYRLDYENDKLEKENEENQKEKFLEFKIATVLRDKIENNIPSSSTMDKKSSNLFGSINNNLFENINLGYNFSIDNDLKTFESHSVTTELSINNFITSFGYIEQRNELGSGHALSNKTSYKIDENNSFSFATRRNIEISLIEYYDFSYQYETDCLTAAIKYNKKFYQDSDLKPEETLFFSITLIPLTTYERRIYEK